MRWFPWWNRVINSQRRDRFSSSLPHAPSSLLCWLPIYHDITVMENARTHMQQMKWKVTAELKSAREKPAGVLGWNLADSASHQQVTLKWNRWCHSGVKKQQLGVAVCKDNSRLNFGFWKKSARNNLFDKGGCKGKARYTNTVNIFPVPV